MKEYRNETFPLERALYGENGLKLTSCRFEGIEDGESALKECRNIHLDDVYMDLRYPLWHDDIVNMHNVTMTDKCRAALWYTDHINITDSNLGGIKALRECKNIYIARSTINSAEFGWRISCFTGEDLDITSEYLFSTSDNIRLSKVHFKGKYSFQYTENVHIKDSLLDTKDAFWHSKNVTVENSIIRGEYLAWYSEGLTLINCKIIGTQPLCYCKGLKLINCTMEDCDFSFEYSDVDAEIASEITSVKNPLSGRIIADSIGELLITEDSKYPCNALIVDLSKK